MTKAPKTEGKKRGRPPKAKPEGEAAAPPKAAKPQPKVWNSELDQEEKQLFLRHKKSIGDQKKVADKAISDLRNLYKSAKAQGGFEKADFDFAFQLDTAEQEAKARAKIARNLKIAKIVGSDLGAQLDMFLEPTRVPAADRAYEEGRTDAMQNVAARPKYDPSTEQHRKYLEGFHSVTEARVQNGIKPLTPDVKEHVEKTAKEKAKTGQQKAQDAQAFEQTEKPPAEATDKPAATPSSGTPMTRAQFRAQQEAAKASSGG